EYPADRYTQGAFSKRRRVPAHGPEVSLELLFRFCPALPGVSLDAARPGASYRIYSGRRHALGPWKSYCERRVTDRHGGTTDAQHSGTSAPSHRDRHFAGRDDGTEPGRNG